MTGLYDPSVETLIRAPFRPSWSVTFYPAGGGPSIPLDVTSCELTFDEFWSPYAQGTVTAVIPSDQETLDLLDPRTKVKVRVRAGYVLPDGAKDEEQLAELYLTERFVDRPTNTITMSVQGKEFLFDSWTPLFPGEGWIIDLNVPVWRASTEARDAVTRALRACAAITTDTDPTWDYAGALETAGWADDNDPWAPETEPPLGVCREIADRVRGWFRCDELGTWRLTSRPILAGDAAHRLYVGANGTVLSSRTGLSRDGWYNTVDVTYTWRDTGGVEHETSGHAEVLSGPYAPANTGRVLLSAEYPWKGSTVHAQRRAESILSRHLSRGRTMDLDAVAAYWLRPGDTVTVQLPLGPQERHLVSAVNFRLHEASMTVTTRVPDDATQIGGG